MRAHPHALLWSAAGQQHALWWLASDLTTFSGPKRPEMAIIIIIIIIYNSGNNPPDSVFLGSFNTSFDASKEHILVNLPQTGGYQLPASRKSFVSF